MSACTCGGVNTREAIEVCPRHQANAQLRDAIARIRLADDSRPDRAEYVTGWNHALDNVLREMGIEQ